MIAELVTSLREAQIVRTIRNEVRSYMTRNTAFITPEQQVIWFSSHSDRLYLYYDYNGAVIGYGLIRDIDGKWFGTLAVMPEFQNNGYGTEIYKHLIQQVDILYIEIDATNIPSMRSAVNAGFNIEYVGDKIIVWSARSKK